MKFKIYTDGACSGNPGKGGWAAVILDSNLNQKSIDSLSNNQIQSINSILEKEKNLLDFFNYTII